jgi:hypothetical protein
MALNKHMAAAVAEIEDDINQLKRLREVLPMRAREERAQFRRDLADLRRVARTIDSLYGGPEPEKPVTPPVKYLPSGRATACAAALPEPLTAVLLAWAAVCSNGAASKCLKRWLADGWVKKVRHGQYVRTAKFPAAKFPPTVFPPA